ncbi:hypothetical protein [Streptomyces vinaceus]|uniref:hypothetical protein n=1 Tax=Streptomyces vinaceus TaxID=1960 RepID=UPI00381344A5
MRGRPAAAGSAPAELLGLAYEFRVPIPDAGVGGKVMVRRQPDGAGDRWAMTDGVFSGLRA